MVPMATNRTIRFKTDVNADTKVKADLKGKKYRSAQEASFSEADAKALVEGGFADYLDASGNVLYEGEPEDAKGSTKESKKTATASPKKAASTSSKDEKADQ